MKRLCPHCSNVSIQEIKFQHSFYPQFYNSRGERDDEFWIELTYFIAICWICNDIIIYNGMREEDMSILYPKITLDWSVPHEVQLCYREAHEIKNRAPNAYAVMIRKCIEMICDDRKIKKWTLQKRLQELSDRWEIPPTILELTNILRELGNSWAHSWKLSITIPMTRDIEKFFQAIIEYIYIAPSMIKSIKIKITKK